MTRLILAAAFPTDSEGAPLAGYVHVATAEDARLILDAEPRAAVPDGADVLSEGRGRYGRTALGTAADRVLEATWERTVDTSKEIVREKVSQALARNPTVELTGTDLVPHRWAGEEA